jgi:hypothetical protein
MMRNVILAALAAVLLIEGCRDLALAQGPTDPSCPPKEKFLAFLDKRFGEVPIAEGKTTRGMNILFAANLAKKTVTVIGQKGADSWCLVDAIKDFEVLSVAKPGQDS